MGSEVVDDGDKSITIGCDGDFVTGSNIEFDETLSTSIAFGARVGPGLFSASASI